MYWKLIILDNQHGNIALIIYIIYKTKMYWKQINIYQYLSSRRINCTHNFGPHLVCISLNYISKTIPTTSIKIICEKHQHVHKLVTINIYISSPDANVVTYSGAYESEYSCNSSIFLSSNLYNGIFTLKSTIKCRFVCKQYLYIGWNMP